MPNPRRRPPVLDWLALSTLCLLVQLPGLLHWIDSNPLPLISSFGQGGAPGLLSGFPGWIDPNIGQTTQALGHLAASDWLVGRLPWWNSYNGIGVPLAAEMQPAALFLPFVLLLHLHDGLLWLRVAMCALSGIGAYELARQLGYGRLACWVAGLLFAFNGTAAWLPHGPERAAAFLPWVLLGVERARAAAVQGRPLGWVGLALALAASLYAGFPEVAYLDGLLAAVWAGWRLVRPGVEGSDASLRLRLLGKLAAGLVVALLLSAPATLPFADYLRHGDVGAHAAGWLAYARLPRNGFPLLLLPYLYGPIEGWPPPVGTVLRGAWGLTGGYLSAAATVLALLRLIAGRGRDGGLRWVLAFWIALCLAKTAALPGVTHLVNLLPLLRRVAFFRYAEPSWELAAILLAAAAVDDWRQAGLAWWRALVAGLLAAALVAVALLLARPTILALSSLPGYAPFPIFAAEWALLLAVLLPLLLARPPRWWRRGLVLGLVGLDAIAMFALPLASATQGVRIDRAPIDFLRTHLGLQRFYSMTALPPNYGALFGIAQVNDDMLPVPQLWAEHVHTALDPLAVPATFSGSNGSRPSGPNARDMLFAHVDAYRALGVRYVVTPRGEDSLDGEIAAAQLNQAGTPLVLAPGATIGGTLPAGFAQGRTITEIGVSLGTYGGLADGELVAELCTSRGCEQAQGALRGAADGAVLSMALAAALPTTPGDALRFTLAHRGGTHRVVAWLLPGSVARLDDAASAAGPGIVLGYARTGTDFRRVFRDAHVDIFELSRAAPYFSTDGGCALAPVSRTVLTADCPRNATLTRRELAFPGWRARANDERKSVGSDGLFQTVALPAGHAVVEFLYAPPFIGFAWAAACLGVFWIAVAVAGPAWRATARSPFGRRCRIVIEILRPDAGLLRPTPMRAAMAALLGAAVAGFWLSEAQIGYSLPRLATIAMSLASPAPGTLHLFVDEGAGFLPAPTAAIGLRASETPRRYEVLLRVPAIRRVRLDTEGVPITPPPSLTVSSIRGATMRLAAAPAGSGTYASPQTLRFDAPLTARLMLMSSVLTRLLAAGLFAALCWQVLARALQQRARLQAPVSAIFAVATLAAVASLYPVVFANRSLISPGNGGNWLAYPLPPFVPGASPGFAVVPVHGADTGATAWQYRGYSAVQAEALAQGELPLFNRYASAGVSLIGQGTSQLGDPLHWITITARGAGWAWDAKFLLAKVLFCAGTGIAVLLATRSAGAALIVAGSVAFLGVFAYRLSHPAYFALCYAPWLWVGFMLLVNREARARGFVLLLLAATMEMSSGAVKEGYVAVLLAFVSGGLMATVAAAGSRRAGPLGRAVLAGVLVPLLTAPWWLTFYMALQRSINYAPDQTVGTLPSIAAPLLLDNAFQMALSSGQLGVPSANPMLVLLAIAGVASVRHWVARPALCAAVVQVLVCLSVAFSVVPPVLVGTVPLIGDIGHVGDVFLLTAIPPLAILAGGGLASLLASSTFRRRATAVAAAILATAALLLPFARAAFWSPGVNGFAFQPGVIVAVLAGLGLIFTALLRDPAWRRSGVGGATLLVGLLAAHLPYGLHLPLLAHAAGGTLASPAQRVDFGVRSPGIEQARRLQNGPYRIVGSDGFLFPGYNVSLLIEGINGPEPLIVPAYSRLMRALGFDDTFGWGWLHLLHWGDLPRLRRALDVFGVRAVIAGPGADTSSSAQVGAFAAASDVSIIERPTAWPRAFLTDRIVRGDDSTEFARALAGGDGRPFAMLPRSVSLGVAPGHMIVPATRYNLSPETTVVGIDAPGPGILVLGEIDLGRELVATLDGVPIPPIRVNAAFQGYLVRTPGPHVLRVRFVPAGWHVGLLLGAAGLLGTLAAWLVSYTRVARIATRAQTSVLAFSRRRPAGPAASPGVTRHPVFGPGAGQAISPAARCIDS